MDYQHNICYPLKTLLVIFYIHFLVKKSINYITHSYSRFTYKTTKRRMNWKTKTNKQQWRKRALRVGVNYISLSANPSARGRGLLECGWRKKLSWDTRGFGACEARATWPVWATKAVISCGRGWCCPRWVGKGWKYEISEPEMTTPGSVVSLTHGQTAVWVVTS